MAREHSVSLLKIKEVVFPPAYMSRCTSCVRVSDELPEVDAASVMAALLFNREDKINTLQITRSTTQNCRDRLNII